MTKTCKWNRTKTRCHRSDGVECKITRRRRTIMGKRWFVTLASPPGPDDLNASGFVYIRDLLMPVDSKAEAMEVCEKMTPSKSFMASTGKARFDGMKRKR